MRMNLTLTLETVPRYQTQPCRRGCCVPMSGYFWTDTQSGYGLWLPGVGNTLVRYKQTACSSFPTFVPWSWCYKRSVATCKPNRQLLYICDEETPCVCLLSFCASRDLRPLIALLPHQDSSFARVNMPTPCDFQHATKCVELFGPTH